MRNSSIVFFFLLFLIALMQANGQQLNSSIRNVVSINPTDSISYDLLELGVELVGEITPLSRVKFVTIDYTIHKPIIIDFEIEAATVISNLSKGKGPGEYQDIFTHGRDEHGNVYFADTGNSKLLVYDKNLAFAKEIVYKQAIPSFFKIMNRHIFFASSNYTVNGFLHRGNLDGSIINSFGVIEKNNERVPIAYEGPVTANDSLLIYLPRYRNHFIYFDKNSNEILRRNYVTNTPSTMSIDVKKGLFGAMSYYRSDDSIVFTSMGDIVGNYLVVGFSGSEYINTSFLDFYDLKTGQYVKSISLQKEQPTNLKFWRNYAYFITYRNDAKTGERLKYRLHEIDLTLLK